MFLYSPEAFKENYMEPWGLWSPDVTVLKSEVVSACVHLITMYLSVCILNYTF